MKALTCAAVALAAMAAVAEAQPVAPDEAPVVEEAPAADEAPVVDEVPVVRNEALVTPARLLAPVVPVYPSLAKDSGLEADVAVLIDVSATGAVTSVVVVEPVGSGFDEAALAAARAMRFTPAQQAGMPVASQVQHTFAFRKETAPRSQKPEPQPVRSDETYRTEVWLGGDDSTVGTVVLSEEELRELPGTLGEPMRAVMLLPGVTTSTTGVAYPIIRGSLPGESQYVVDGIQVPLLYHFMLGTSVLHPNIIGELEFHPGGVPAQHGRLLAGLVEAHLADAPVERKDEVRLTLVDVGLYHGQPIGEDADLVAAVKAGTLGAIAWLIDPSIIVSYADYQARYRHDIGAGRLSLTALGAWDLIKFVPKDDEDTAEDDLWLGFHRLDLRYDRPVGASNVAVGVELGYDAIGSNSNGRDAPVEGDPDFPPERPDPKLSDWRARPHAQLTSRLTDTLGMRVGADVLLQRPRVRGADITSADELEPSPYIVKPSSIVTSGAWLGLDWILGALTVRPGVRVDHYRTNTDEGRFTDTTIDPRLALDYRVHRDATLKAAVGVYHSPPRFTLVDSRITIGPVPATDGRGARYGSNRSLQTQLGIEAWLADMQATATAFYQQSDYAIDLGALDLPVVPDDREFCDTGTFVEDSERARPVGVKGRSYGLELMGRQPLGEEVFGWVSYTLSRNEREVAGVGRFPTNFDQTHVLNGALSWTPNRRWTLGVAAQVHSGVAATGVISKRCELSLPDQPGYTYVDTKPGRVNGERLPWFWRGDVRAERHFELDGWKLHVFFEMINATLQTDYQSLEVNNAGETKPSGFPIVVPMIGARGEF